MSKNPIESFPLCWPPGWKRATYRKRSQFASIAFGRARDEAIHELKLMGAPSWEIIISTNIPLRRDGLPYSGQANPADPGVAVYFKRSGHQMVLACDTYRDVTDNMWAIRKTIEALRGIKRWGASDMLERAFTGFQALPAAPAKAPWWEVLRVPRGAMVDEVKASYRELARRHHSDVTSDDGGEMYRINAAWAEFQKERQIK